MRDEREERGLLRVGCRRRRAVRRPELRQHSHVKGGDTTVLSGSTDDGRVVGVPLQILDVSVELSAEAGSG